MVKLKVKNPLILYKNLFYIIVIGKNRTFHILCNFFLVILEKLLTQENRVLDYWTSKKKRLDQNQQFCLFERSARQSLAWIKEEGDIYLKTHTNVGSTTEETQALLKEHNSFKVFDTFKETQC